MKLKRILFLFLLAFFGWFTASFAVETTEIDFSAVATNFNKNSYVSKLASIGINVSAVQTNNSVILHYNDTDSITYSYDSSTKIFSSSYSAIQPANRNILSAIFIDTISTMQGNTEGVQIPFGLDDTHCYSYLQNDGIQKDYITDDNGNILIRFQINSSIKLPIKETTASIDENVFLTEYETFYTKDDCFAKSEDLIFYRTYNNDNGSLEIYIGQSNEFNNFSYDSLLTALSIIFKEGDDNNEKVIAYFKQNYEGFSNGNFDFTGVNIDTSITELPVKNVQTLLVAPSMKYAKVTIDEDTVMQQLPNVVIEQKKDSTKISKNNSSVPLVISILVIGLVIIIMLIGVLIRRNQNLDE